MVALEFDPLDLVQPLHMTGEFNHVGIANSFLHRNLLDDFLSSPFRISSVHIHPLGFKQAPSKTLSSKALSTLDILRNLSLA